MTRYYLFPLPPDSFQREFMERSQRHRERMSRIGRDVSLNNIVEMVCSTGLELVDESYSRGKYKARFRRELPYATITGEVEIS